MADDKRHPKRPSHPTSLPPEVPLELDSSWDVDTMPRLELDDPMSESAFDRVTAIPEMPAEMFAQQMMSEQPKSAPPERSGPAPSGEMPRLASEPPVVAVRPLDPMAMQQAPRAGRAVSLAEVPAAPHSAASPTSATTRPGKNRTPLSAEPTGL